MAKRKPKFQHPEAHPVGHVAPTKAESKKAHKVRQKAKKAHVKKLQDRQVALDFARDKTRSGAAKSRPTKVGT